MLSESDIRSAVETALSASSCDETEVWIGGGKSGLTRFANNEVHQHVEVENYVANLRAIVGKRWGRARSTTWIERA